MTGVEAISNGVPAFKPPESRNAARALVWIAVLLGKMFVGTIVRPLVRYVELLHQEQGTEGRRPLVTVLLPEVMPASRWGHLLRRQPPLRVKGAVLFRQQTAVRRVPYLLRN
jgi:hypothetical protein